MRGGRSDGSSSDHCIQFLVFRSRLSVGHDYWASEMTELLPIIAFGFACYAVGCEHGRADGKREALEFIRERRKQKKKIVEKVEESK